MKKSLFGLLVLLCLKSVAAEPVPVAAVNLNFDKWENGAPVGWASKSAAFRTSSDCAAGQVKDRCVLRIDSTDAYRTGSMFPVGQRIALGAAAGHSLTLSGMIRTDQVEGGVAALWLRADARSGPSLGLDNMATRAPSGTTGWTRFSVSVPVPGNAAGVLLGVMLTGKGTAWFDDLQLSADTSVNVADAVRPVIKAAPRPAPSQELLADAALRIAPADIAPASEAWRADVARRVHPIRSLYSDDFSDLQFLKPLLAGKRVVQLGESGHGVGEFNLAKVRLIKFLHQQMGYDVIAFESSLPQCYLADQAIGAELPINVMKRCIFPQWHGAETLPLFDYLEGARKGDKRLTLAGFDTQDSAKAPGAAQLLGKMLELDSWPRASELAPNEIVLFNRTMNKPLAPEVAARLAAYYGDAASVLEKNRARLLKAGAEPDALAMAIQSARSRVRLTGQFAATASTHGMETRDAGMADNLDFLLDTLYPGRKVIVWAHNAHITYQPGAGYPKMMGAIVAERRKAEVYTVGLFMGHGAATMNDREPYEIAAPAAGTFDAVMTNGGARYAFVDFSTAKPGPETSWIFAPIVMRSWGTKPELATPASGYDGVLYIDAVTPPQYR
jgi:erythromycin esterase